MSDKPDWRPALEAVVEEQRGRSGPHPELDELAAYHGGRLQEPDVARVRRHLVLCRECARLLLDLETFAGDAAKAVPIERPRAPRRKRWQALIAVAAALLLVVIAWPLADPLPPYAEPRLDGAVQLRRDADSDRETGTFEQFSPFRYTLQPQTAAGPPVTARAYLRHGGRFHSLSDSTLEVDERDGVVSLAGTLGTEVRLPVGDSELIVAVARRPWMLPSRHALDHGLSGQDEASGWFWTGVRQRIRVEASELEGLPSSPLVEYGGCRMIGFVCYLDGERALTLRVRHPPGAEVWIDAGGWWEAHTRTEVPNGSRFRVRVPGGSRRVVVEVRRSEGRSIWMLEVNPESEPAPNSKAEELRAGGAVDEARRLLEPLTRAADPSVAGPALSRLARLEHDAGRSQLGDRLFRTAIEVHRGSGRLWDQIWDVAGWSYHLIQEHRFAEAGRQLDSLPPGSAGGSAESRYVLAYYRGLLAERTGDLRNARLWMRQAMEAAAFAGRPRLAFFAEDILARQEAAAGRPDAARTRYQQMQAQREALCAGEAPELTRCDCARHDVNRAWVELLAAEGGLAARGDPGDAFRRAEEVLAAESARRTKLCPVRRDELPNVRLNLALSALQAGDIAEARRHLERTGAEAQSFPRLALWQLDVEARLLLAEERPGAALERYDELAKRAGGGSAPEAAWRASFGRALALHSLRRRAEAVDACGEGDRLLDEESLLIPGYDRGRFLAQRQRAARFCLELLLESGREREALDLIRRSAVRALSDLRAGAALATLGREQRRAWEQARLEIEQLDAELAEGVPRDREIELLERRRARHLELRDLHDRSTWLASSGRRGGELAPPAEGEVMLACHPLPEGWVAIAADRLGAAAHRSDALPELGDLHEVAARLLEPFADRIAGADQIRIVPFGDLRDVDFASLPFGRGILLEQAPIVYHLDLPGPSIEVSSEGKVLVLAGPGLPEARREAEAVRRQLGRAVLLERDVTGAELRKELTGAWLFHYAGHAAYDDESLGWDSHLPLWHGFLTVDDVLALPRAPRWVVLSGCETGRDSRDIPLPSIGLAQAFLVAGSEAVVAASGEVSDSDARTLMEALYGHWRDSTPLAEALRRAQLEMRSRFPDSGWNEFRVLGR